MTDWMDLAACRGHESIMYPVAANREQVAVAKAICAPCPVLNDCLQYALVRNEEHGVWGGMGEDERRRIRRRLRRIATEAGPEQLAMLPYEIDPKILL